MIDGKVVRGAAHSGKISANISARSVDKTQKEK